MQTSGNSMNQGIGTLFQKIGGEGGRGGRGHMVFLMKGGGPLNGGGLEIFKGGVDTMEDTMLHVYVPTHLDMQ